MLCDSGGGDSPTGQDCVPCIRRIRAGNASWKYFISFWSLLGGPPNTQRFHGHKRHLLLRLLVIWDTEVTGLVHSSLRLFGGTHYGPRAPGWLALVLWLVWDCLAAFVGEIWVFFSWLRRRHLRSRTGGLEPWPVLLSVSLGFSFLLGKMGSWYQRPDRAWRVLNEFIS